MDLRISDVSQRIYSVRGFRIVLDRDLAEFYQTQTKTLNQAVRRNAGRFPSDFMFQLKFEEQAALPKTISTETRGGRRTLAFAFTQEGISMLSSVLSGDRAVEVNILIMRAFVQLRRNVEAQHDLVQRFEQLESRCTSHYQDILGAVLRGQMQLSGPDAMKDQGLKKSQQISQMPSLSFLLGLIHGQQQTGSHSPTF